VQKAAKCIIGVHYPKPMVHHAEASRINIERMKQIYQQLSCYRGLGKDALLNAHALISLRSNVDDKKEQQNNRDTLQYF